MGRVNGEGLTSGCLDRPKPGDYVKRMLSSSRFVVAIHALSVIARAGGRSPVCSTIIAQSINTNPVVIRRLMRDLERAELVSSATGRAGGFTLSRAPSTITLADIYHAVEDEGTFRLHKTDPESRCPVGCQILNILSAPLRSAENALAHSLAKTTLGDITARIA
jgi:Rrf2 family protein